MSAVVVFDSNYGNTERVAEAIAAGIGGATTVSVARLDPANLQADLLVVGSPINGWRPTAAMQKFLAGFGAAQLAGTRAAAFDTRVRLFIHGDAAGKISRALENAGATIVARPRGFIVKGTEGPLLDGELEAATAWGRSIAAEVARTA
ncbi:flavodoxin family protein [Lacisediminihabitans profunda]|uniref:Flavodoxin n=1 Tax=Lacisediminihabitans profunda TaxID=2594790 RepID=A0A5C8ULJ4_9MICO|nr:flavodoxin family protein [Lacisediminihabitans profunda]TXN29183.1 flavodoxin [Lacisediminihabitans profunda]